MSDGYSFNGDTMQALLEGVKDGSSMIEKETNNLLDNWYFIEPIAQFYGDTREASDAIGYNISGSGATASKYVGFDRWHFLCSSTNTNLKISWNPAERDNGFSITTASKVTQLTQNLYDSDLENGTYTFTFLCSDPSVISKIFVTKIAISTSSPSSQFFNSTPNILNATTSVNGLWTATFNINDITSDQSYRYVFGVNFKSSPSVISGLIAAKLEKGSTQTLCTQVNGVWKLSDYIPSYENRLKRCREWTEVFGPTIMGGFVTSTKKIKTIDTLKFSVKKRYLPIGSTHTPTSNHFYYVKNDQDVEQYLTQISTTETDYDLTPNKLEYQIVTAAQSYVTTGGSMVRIALGDRGFVVSCEP